MCNIAGYVGSRPAAPILIDMLRREEGWDAGYYAGIATLSDGKIHHAKRMGDLQSLLSATDAASLPGTVGIIHGRTPSGGGDAWAHPFIGGCGTQTSAYVANGSLGRFADRIDAMSAIATVLEAAGYPLSSHQSEPVKHYPTLPDGGSAHSSDVMAQLIAQKIDGGLAPSDAMGAAFCEMPGEIVGLLLTLCAPDQITWSRVSMPMFVAFAPHGAYLASTPQAFPEDAGEATLLPACSCGTVHAAAFTAMPYAKAPAHVAPITPRVMHEAYGVIVQALQTEPHTLPQLAKLVKPLFDSAECYPLSSLVYSILASLQKENRLIVQTKTVPGMAAGLTAPCFYASLKRPE